MMKLMPVMAHVWQQIAKYKEQLEYEEINRQIKKLYKILLRLFFYIQGVAVKNMGYTRITHKYFQNLYFCLIF